MWNARTLPGQIARDMREAAFRKGAPTPESEPPPAIGDPPMPHCGSRRRIVILK